MRKGGKREQRTSPASGSALDGNSPPPPFRHAETLEWRISSPTASDYNNAQHNTTKNCMNSQESTTKERDCIHTREPTPKMAEVMETAFTPSESNTTGQSGIWSLHSAPTRTIVKQRQDTVITNPREDNPKEHRLPVVIILHSQSFSVFSCSLSFHSNRRLLREHSRQAKTSEIA